MSSLLAFTVYMLIASSFLPETSAGAPRLVIFNLVFFFAMSFCLCATCYSLKNPSITWTEFKAKICSRCNNQSSQKNSEVVENTGNEEVNATKNAIVSKEPNDSKTDEGGEQEGNETQSNRCFNFLSSCCKMKKGKKGVAMQHVPNPSTNESSKKNSCCCFPPSCRKLDIYFFLIFFVFYVVLVISFVICACL